MRELLTTAWSLRNQAKPTWILENLIPKNAVAVLYGKPKSGKSFLALNWALQLANSGIVTLYIAGEGLGGYGARLRAWADKFESPVTTETPLLFAQHGINLTVGDTVSRLIQQVNKHSLLEGFTTVEHVRDEGDIEYENVEYTKPVGLIVIDTLSRAIPGGDENDAATMSAAIEQIDRLRTETNAAVLIVHHTTKDSPDDDNARERGSSALRGAVDVMIHQSLKKHALTVTAARDFESGATWNYKLTPHLESAIIELTAPDKAGEQLGDAQQVVYDGLLLGYRTIAGLGTHTQMSTQHIWATLNKLIDKGVVEKQGRGVYAPIGQDLDKADQTP